jgi:hypothetical protein
MPGSFLPDATCMIAAVCSWHGHHDRGAQTIVSRLDITAFYTKRLAQASQETEFMMQSLPPALELRRSRRFSHSMNRISSRSPLPIFWSSYREGEAPGRAV